MNCPVFQFCEQISEKYSDAIILTDLDKEGKKSYRKLKESLGKNGVRIDNRFRNYLFNNTKLTQIEGIISYLGVIF